MMTTTLTSLPPSANAVAPHVQTSERYQFINTASLVERFLQMGMSIRTASQARVRRPDYNGYQRHIVRLQTPFEVSVNGDVSNLEVLLVNQHIGSHSLQMRFGLFRLVCTNGLVVGTDMFGMSVRHYGAQIDRTIDQMMTFIETSMPTVRERVTAMGGRRMSSLESRQFVQDALTIRGVAEDDTLRRNAVAPVLLTVKRDEDRDETLWNVFNRTQEHLMSGVSGRRRQGLRRISAPSRDLDVNSRLWALAESYL